MVRSPLIAANATFALNPALCFLRVRFMSCSRALPRFLGAGLHLSHLSHFRGPAHRYSRKKARLGKIQQIVISKAIPRPGGGAAHSPIKSVNWSGRGFIGEFTDGICDPASGCHAVIIPGGRKLVGTGSAFLERFLAVPLQHE